MAVNNEYPVLDGIAPSWADIAVKATPIGGELIDIKDIKEISTGSSVEVGEQRGASGGRVMRRTTGSVSYEASMTLYRSGHQKLLRSLMAIAPQRGVQRLVTLVHFQIQIQHTPIGDEEIYERLIKGCRLMGDSLNMAEGTDADTVEIPLNTIEVVNIVDGLEVVML